MYEFMAFPKERYYLIRIKGEFYFHDCKKFVQQMRDFAALMNGEKWGSLNDMREQGTMSKETQDLLVEGMKESIQLGFHVVARVVDQMFDKDVIEKHREANLKAGFIGHYFTDMERAKEFIIKTLKKYDDTHPKI
jgi:hypothetical protein